jgi:hypothetical protein
VKFLKRNKSVVQTVSSKLQTILHTFAEKSESNTKKVTKELTTKIRMRDIDVGKMKAMVHEAQEAVEAMQKVRAERSEREIARAKPAREKARLRASEASAKMRLRCARAKRARR